MKTTLDIPAPVVARLRHEAARRKTTMSALVETALRFELGEPHDSLAVKAAVRRLTPLPSWKRGGLRVNVDDRDELYRVMEDGDESEPGAKDAAQNDAPARGGGGLP